MTAGPEGSEFVLPTDNPPVLCTGFKGSVASSASHLFNMGEGMTEAAKGCLCGAPLLTDEDQSTEVRVGVRVRARARVRARMRSGLGFGLGLGLGNPNPNPNPNQVPGVFLVGPNVRHGSRSFCFVYKFRQRFGIVAEAIARGLGLDTDDGVAACRDMNMFLDDFTCCKSACGEAC